MHRKILFLAFVFITFLFLARAGHFLFNKDDLDKVLVLDEGWNVLYNDTEYKDVKLSELRELLGHATFKGDVIVLSKELSGLGSFDGATLAFETRFSGYEIFFNGQWLFGDWYQPEYQNRFVGCHNIYATLPRTYEPGTIAIKLYITQDGAYSYYEPVLLGGFRDITLYIIYHTLFVLLISVFLIIFGLLFFVIATGFRTTMGEFRMQAYGSLLFVTLGIWFLAQFKLLDLFIETNGHQTEIEYISLYLAAPLMVMVIGCVHDHLKSKLFVAFASVAVFVAILPIILHFTGILYINKSLILFQIDGLVLLVYLVYLLITDFKGGQMTTSQYVQLVGQAILALSFLFNVIFYFLEQLGLSEQILLSKISVPVGALLMAFTMLVNYCLYIAESYARRKEYQSLAHLAYADGLTNLPNRSRYEKYVSDLSQTLDDYCIISIDLNGLKGVNDNQGHLMGDRYITDASKALSEAFGEKGFVARIGGDEFVAVLRGEELNMAGFYINMLNTALDNLNKKDPSIKRSAAAGFAFRHEADDDNWNSVYLLADERMYETKVKMYAAR